MESAVDYEKENELIKNIKSVFKEAVCTVKRERRIEIELPSDRLFEFATRMQKNWDYPHLSAISCVDWIKENQFELVYHFWSYSKKILVSAKIRIPREDEPHFESISSLWQPAKFFERDIHEMFGVVFDGNDDLEKFILTEWKGSPPMRKDFITRKYSIEFYGERKYNPEWMKELKKLGDSNDKN